MMFLKTRCQTGLDLMLDFKGIFFINIIAGKDRMLHPLALRKTLSHPNLSFLNAVDLLSIGAKCRPVFSCREVHTSRFFGLSGSKDVILTYPM